MIFVIIAKIYLQKTKQLNENPQGMEIPQGKLDGLQKAKAKIEKELLKETDKLENERKKYEIKIIIQNIFYIVLFLDTKRRRLAC